MTRCETCLWFEANPNNAIQGYCLVDPVRVQKPAKSRCSRHEPLGLSVKLVVIESPFKAPDGVRRIRNANYLCAAILDSINRGEAPYASHAFYTQFLNDDALDERSIGITLGLTWGEKCDLVAAYADFGISEGMSFGLNGATARGTLVDRRWILNDGPFTWKPPLNVYNEKFNRIFDL